MFSKWNHHCNEAEERSFFSRLLYCFFLVFAQLSSVFHFHLAGSYVEFWCLFFIYLHVLEYFYHRANIFVNFQKCKFILTSYKMCAGNSVYVIDVNVIEIHLFQLTHFTPFIHSVLRFLYCWLLLNLISFESTNCWH